MNRHEADTRKSFLAAVPFAMLVVATFGVGACGSTEKDGEVDLVPALADAGSPAQDASVDAGRCPAIACAKDQVCCDVAQAPCYGTCVPDCRSGGGCPDQRTCDQATGLCRPGALGDGGLPPPGDGGRPPPPDASAGQCPETACGADQVCCDVAQAPCYGTCVPDCRSGATCPDQRECDQPTGLCRPGAVGDGGLPPPSGDGGQPPHPSDGGLPPPPADGGEDCASSGCSAMADTVCCTAPLACAGRCVPDCRKGASCPTQVPTTCDQDTGLCH